MGGGGEKQTGWEIEGQTDAVQPDDKAAWQFGSQALCGGELSGSMPGIVYYEFAVLQMDQRCGAGEDADEEEINEKTMTGGGVGGRKI